MLIQKSVAVYRRLILAGAIAALPAAATSIPITNSNFSFVENVAGCSSGNTLNSGSFIDATIFYAGGCVFSDPFDAAGGGGWTIPASGTQDDGVLSPTGLYTQPVPGGSGANVALSFVSSRSVNPVPTRPANRSPPSPGIPISSAPMPLLRPPSPAFQPPITISWLFQCLSLIHDADRRPGW